MARFVNYRVLICIIKVKKRKARVNSIAMYRPLPGLICKRHFLRACAEVLDVVAISTPGIQFLLNQSFQLAATAPDLGRAVVGWALWSREPSLSSAATVLTSRNHLTLDNSSFNGSSCPVSDQDLLVLVTWTNVPSLSTSSPVDTLTGAHWEGLALQERLEECKHRRWSGWSQESWSYLGQSKLLIFNWVGGWDVWAVHQLPTSKFPNICTETYVYCISKLLSKYIYNIRTETHWKFWYTIYALEPFFFKQSSLPSRRFIACDTYSDFRNTRRDNSLL